MNDQGLVISASLSPKINIDQVQGKKTIGSPLEGIRFNEFIYRRCATVAQVLKEIKKINFTFLQTSHILITDRTGASAILEGDGEGNLVVYYHDRQAKIIPDGQTNQWVEQAPEPLPPHLRKGRDYNVITNFLHSQLGLGSRLGGYPCRRYDIAQKMLAPSDGISPALFRNILQKTHLEGDYPTKLSTVYDLKKGDVNLYYLHNFDKGIYFNLEEELKKGAHSYDLRSLFKLRWHPLFLLCALVLLSAVFFYPVEYIFRRFRGKKSPFAGKKGRYFALAAFGVSAINSMIVLFFIYRFPYILSHQLHILKFNLYENFFYHYKDVFFAIPVLTLAMLLFTVFAWSRKYGSLICRIHYTLVLIVISAVLAMMV